MASGKSTVGKYVARLLGTEFFDLDRVITGETQRSIDDIFASEGEDAFRALELKALMRTLEKHPGAVIATGGGTMCRQESWDALPQNAFVVWLNLPLEVLAARVGSGARRPLLRTASSPREALEDLLAKRKSWYSRAHVTLDTDELEPNQVAQGILASLEAHEAHP